MHSLGRSGAGVFGSLASTQRSFRNSFSYRLAQNGIHALNNIGGNTDTVSQPRSVMQDGAFAKSSAANWVAVLPGTWPLDK